MYNIIHIYIYIYIYNLNTLCRDVDPNIDIRPWALSEETQWFEGYVNGKEDIRL